MGRSNKGRFFAVDRGSWREVCGLGMNEAVAYLVLAQGTGGDNQSTSWSANSLHVYTGITFERAKLAIEKLGLYGFVRHAPTHTRTKPRYELPAWPDMAKAKHDSMVANLSDYALTLLAEIRSGKRPKNSASLTALLSAGIVCWKDSFQVQELIEADVNLEPDPIWLPNAIVTGTRRGEDSPLKRLRRAGDVWTLRLFVDLYHAHNLRDNGGINPAFIRKDFSKKEIGHQGTFTIWAFKPEGITYWSRGPFADHNARKKTQDGESPVWDSIYTLEQLGLLTFVPHLWENDSNQAEIIHAYGLPGLGEPVEIEMGLAADRAARRMAIQANIDRAAAEGFCYLAPVRDTIPECAMIGTGRLRYRPHTKRTATWFAEIQTQGKRRINEYNNLALSNEL